MCVSLCLLVMILQELDEEARRILEGLEQQKLERGGKKASVGSFTEASLEKNKHLSMFPSNKKDKGITGGRYQVNNMWRCSISTLYCSCVGSGTCSYTVACAASTSTHNIS